MIPDVGCSKGTMNKILEAHGQIYDHIQDFSSCGWHECCSRIDFERYCVAKDTVQDTAEAVMSHRAKGFTDNVYLRYVEYYGVLQAIYMQQDAIQALFELFMAPDRINYSGLPNWQTLRDLRNDTVGHPVGKLKRLNRNQIAYDCVNYQWFTKDKQSSFKSENIDLGAVLDGYNCEAGGVLQSIWTRLEAECPIKHTQQTHAEATSETAPRKRE